MSQPEGVIGQPVDRIEDERLLRGRARFVADVQLPGVAHAVVVRSTEAHAVIDGIDLEHARRAPGVLDAFTGRDVVAHLRPLPSHRPIAPQWEAYRQLPLAVERVRYVGEPVAVVVAESRHLAEDAAEHVAVDTTPLAVVSSIDQIDPAPLFDGHSNVVNIVHKEAGLSPDEARAAADVIVEEEFFVQRHSGVPLETRGLVARPDDDGGMTLWGVAKMPHFTRAAAAEMLDLDPELVRVEPVSIGGGFGVRGEIYAEDFLVPYAARRIGRPVQWIEDRIEHLLGTNHSRESHWRVRAGATRDGELVFLHGEVCIDIGGYVRPLIGVVAEHCALNLLGPYRVRSFTCHGECALTNKMGIGTVRAPGRYEATFAREGILDRLAEAVGQDPVALRARNLLTAEDFPYDTGVQSFGNNVIYDSGDPQYAFGLAAGAVAAARVEREDGLVGIGVIPFVESTGLGPFEHARVSVEFPGRVVVRAATTSMGQGHETSFAQVAAEAVGVGIDEVVVLEGDPRDLADGVGTFASRSMVMTGNAIWLAGTRLREHIEKIDRDRRMTLAEVLVRALEEGIELDVEERFESSNTTYSYGSHAAVVAVDPELGSVDVIRYVVVADVGRVVNPRIVTGQVQGGVVQGVGGALLEELAYSEEGQPLSGSFMDYLLPSALEAVDVEVTLIDRARAPGNPLGIKGAGEVGTTAASAAIASAVRDALGRADAATSLPLTPARVAAMG